MLMCQQGRLRKTGTENSYSTEPDGLSAAESPPPHLAETKNINSDKSASDLVPAAVITFNAGASLSSVLSVTF